MEQEKKKIAVIGLGYVGLPLAVEFGKIYETIGYDINPLRIEQLKAGIDRTKESDKESILAAEKLRFTSAKESIREANVFIVTVPTPIDRFKKPDLRALLSATRVVGEYLKKGDIVIYESTVYPGCTEEDCVPLLEGQSGLLFNKDFYCGYSPERINPGDKINTLTSIKKVTSGSTPEIAEVVDKLYLSIVSAGTYKASSIKVAEAAKAIENAQRDLNISFVNELALIFDKVGIDTQEVLDAAATKWNFLKFKPGLVGGHCISVDPYYLTYKAEQLGYYPQVILSGRRVNDSMGAFVANKIVKLLIRKNIPVKGANVLILGITFKENCPDIRNTKVIDIYKELADYDMKVDVYDPWVDPEEVKVEYGLELLPGINPAKDYQAILLAVSHTQFLEIPYSVYKEKGCVIFDTKAILPKDMVDARL
ncbi:MAG: nucleotide sugar dehydrogenase [Candidatus Azobacteroides sp.]|nr:nucleotide sugar dehydrogenase [Candidatus Azobacteroides sp.]